MSENKNVKKLIPVSIYDIPGMESWLYDMAEKGLYLKNFGKIFAHFEAGKPQKVKYRLEPVGKGDEMPSDEVLEYFRLSGWSYITHINKLFYIYMAKDDDVEEIHTDPVAQSFTFDILNRRLRKLAILITILVLIAIGMLLSKYLLVEQPVLSMVQGQLVNDFVFLILEGFIIIRSIEDARSINRLSKQLKAGVTILHKRDYKKGQAIRISGYSLLILTAAITVILPFVQIAKAWDKNIEEITVQLPAIKLEALEDKESFKYYSEISYSGRNYDNHVHYDWSPVAPVQYEITQNGIVEDMMWSDNSGVYRPSLTTEYYKLSISVLAKPLMEDLISKHVIPHKNMTEEELSAKNLDKAVLFTKGETQYIFAYKGNTVIYISYHGYGSLKSRIDEIANLLN